MLDFQKDGGIRWEILKGRLQMNRCTIDDMVCIRSARHRSILRLLNIYPLQS